METPKEALKRSTAEMMAEMIKRSRERYAALPACEKRAIVRRMEDERFIALAGGGS